MGCEVLARAHRNSFGDQHECEALRCRRDMQGVHLHLGTGHFLSCRDSLLNLPKLYSLGGSPLNRGVSPLKIRC